MLFSSLFFLWVFLPIVFISSFILQRFGGIKAANILLLISSLFFYAWGEPIYIFLMLASILINYSAGMLLYTKYKKVVLAVAVILNLALLGYYKYAGILVKTWNRLTGAEVGIPKIALPIGISFFTFQALSYVIDAYRGDCEIQRNPLKLALYVSFFPQLIAGPIVKYKDVADQIDHRELSLDQTASGIRRFVYGLAKKVLIANVAAQVVDNIYARPTAQLSGAMAGVAVICYTIQIYYDFSGYSDMAIGLGRMFGFEFKENFNYPYISHSIREFWRRWHISLSTWFKEYVYIPLGGNRRGTGRTYMNLLIVFFLTGLWHGAGYNFIFWGLYHGAFIVLERAFYGKWLDRHKVIGWIYTFTVVNVGWIFFRLTYIIPGFRVTKRLLMPWKYPTGNVGIWEIVSAKEVIILIAAILGMGVIQNTSVFGTVIRKLKDSWIEIAVQTLLFIWCLGSLASGTYNPFIYFRF
ncbi:MBOAT family O-acyltransferase [Porcincola intestinalis]|uniref:MBOAT family O-acyltransferase n=1 Tax=Porcincola intestinalis TaxID=2606632 RepID=UPI002A90CEB7|nr:MBOAT family O-acyltransferase [Porcincola intestinalis]MDY5580166.1 MBOAT family O-acyltransferase [Porcincola intestinalis]